MLIDGFPFDIDSVLYSLRSMKNLSGVIFFFFVRTSHRRHSADDQLLRQLEICHRRTL